VAPIHVLVEIRTLWDRLNHLERKPADETAFPISAEHGCCQPTIRKAKDRRGCLRRELWRHNSRLSMLSAKLKIKVDRIGQSHRTFYLLKKL